MTITLTKSQPRRVQGYLSTRAHGLRQVLEERKSAKTARHRGKNKTMNKRATWAQRLLAALIVLTMLMPAAAFVPPLPVAQAANSGWRSPSANAADTGGDGDGFEQLPMEAYADGGGYARNMNGYNDRHRYYNFGFDSLIPAGAVVAGIEVRLDGWADSTSNSPRYDVELSWNGGTSWSNVRSTSTLGNSEATFLLGGQSDLWGYTWSASELADENLRVRIISRASGTGRENRDFFLDWVAVRIYYASAQITGTIWADDNANGVQDDTEAGLKGIHVTIYQDDGDSVFQGGGQDPEVGAGDTDVAGVYDTGPFMDGYSYWIDVVTPTNRYLTTPPVPRLVALPDGNSVTINFGYALQPVTHPSINIAKMPKGQTLQSSNTVTFTIAVTNTGDIALSSVHVTDALAPECNANLGSLNAGASSSYTCSLGNVTANLTNTAMVTGTPPAGAVVTATDLAAVMVIHPAITIAKTPKTQTVRSGDTVTFTIAVSNTGDAALSGVQVTDALAPNCNANLGLLNAGASNSYTCSLDNVTANLTNTATVTGTPLVGVVVTAADTALVRLDETQACPAAMIAYWKLDEASGSTYSDFFDGHDGQCAGQCPTPTTGRVNGGQRFNGSNTGIDVPAHSSFDWGVNDSFSIEFWLQTPSASTCSGNEVAVSRNDASNKVHWWVGCQDGGQAAFYLRDKNNTLGGAIGTTDVTDGAWHHIAAVRTAATNEMRIYVDGTAQGSTQTTFTTGFDSPTAALNIGWINASHGYHLDGIIDEVALYNRALSSDEVQQHHNEGFVGRGQCQGGTFAPQIVSTPATDAIVGQPFSYTIEAVGNPTPTYALLINPSGMSIDPVTGVVSWMPTLEQEGTHDVRVEANNSVGTDTQSFTIEVKKGNPQPETHRIFLPIIGKAACPAAMIAYWKLDEASGPTYSDFFDGHDGQCAGQCPTPTTGRVNAGQRFNGSNTGIDVPAHSSFDWGINDSFSIEFWLQTPSASTCSGNEVAIGRNDASNKVHWWVGCQDGGQAAFYLRDKNNTLRGAIGTTDVTDGAWHHIVAVRTAATNEMRIYVDGTAQGSTQTTFTTGFDSLTAALNIGWINTSHGYHLDGIIDEVALYNRALSSDEVQQHHNEGLAGRCYCQEGNQ